MLHFFIVAFNFEKRMFFMILIYQVLIFKSCLLSILICTYTVLVLKKEMSLIQ